MRFSWRGAAPEDPLFYSGLKVRLEAPKSVVHASPPGVGIDPIVIGASGASRTSYAANVGVVTTGAFGPAVRPSLPLRVIHSPGL